MTCKVGSAIYVTLADLTVKSKLKKYQEMCRVAKIKIKEKKMGRIKAT
jgi:hypothetical protein